jgi:hypothetical protein
MSAYGFQVHTPATLPKTKAISVNTSMVGGHVNFQASLEMAEKILAPVGNKIPDCLGCILTSRSELNQAESDSQRPAESSQVKSTPLVSI